MDIGSKLKELREERNMTIKQLAEKSGCTTSMISQIEHGKSDPSISMLKKLANALETNIVDFFIDDNIISEDFLHIAPNDRIDIKLPRWNAHIQSFIKSTANKKMHPFYTKIKPGGGSKGMYSHEGEEFVYVLKGKLSIKVGTNSFVIKAGEAVYFKSHIPHDWINEAEEDTELIWIITPPSF
jgi:transcriptional regulator with XRE-family HTH domain